MHAFLDGNKRMAALAALIFLEINGAEALPEPDALEEATLAVAASEMSKDDLTDWMQQA
jgi:death-on-curing protein